MSQNEVGLTDVIQYTSYTVYQYINYPASGFTFGRCLGGREGYPRVPGIEKHSPEMNRSRGVRNPRYQELMLTPKNKKVVAG